MKEESSSTKRQARRTFAYLKGEVLITDPVTKPDEGGVDELQQRHKCDQVDCDVRHQFDRHGRSIGRGLHQVTLAPGHE